MVDFSDIMHADLGKLRAAAGEWHLVPKKYQGLTESFDARVAKPLKVDWEGEAADKAQAAFVKLRKQYQAATEESRDIARLLQDAHEELHTLQKQLRRIVEEDAPADKLKVTEDGTVVDADPTRSAGRNADPDHTYLKQRDEKIQALRGRIASVVKRATVADEGLNYALRRDANGAKNLGFNTKVHTSLDAAEADQALALTKSGGKLSDKQLSQLNRILEVKEHDKEFSERLAVGMGPKGALDFWAKVADPEQKPYQPSTEPDKERRALLKHLQENLGTTLGTATHSDSAAMKHWKSEMLDLGPRRLGSGDAANPYGFQVMSNLMRHGNYDSDFLKDYGKKLLDTDRNFNPSIKGAPNPWTYQTESDLNFGSSNDRGNDPMTGFMEALGHNHKASTGFFGSDKDLEYLMKDRVWPDDSTPDGDTKDGLAGYSSLGHALEAASTGHDFGTPPEPGAPHTNEEAEVMSKVITAVSKDDSTIHDGMGGSLGRMSAEYMPDIHHLLSGGRDDGTSDGELDSLYPRGKNPPLLFPEGNGTRDITRFLYTVGKDPDGFAGINYGQTQYTSEVLNYHFAHPDANDRTNSETLEELTRRGGQIESIIDNGRKDAVVQGAVDNDSKFNKALADSGGWAKTIVGIGVGVGTSHIVSPIGGALVGAAAGDVSGRLIDSITEGFVRDPKGDALYSAAGEMEKNQESLRTVTERAASLANANHPSGLSRQDIQAAIQRGAEDGNSLGFVSVKGNTNDNASS